MRRVNPWVAIPVVLAAAGGGVAGALITHLSCSPGSCLPAAIAVGILSAAAGFLGVGVVVVLALRSMDEWRAAQASDRPIRRPPEDPGPPTC
jgi:uncharacterized membrane protein